MVDRHTDNSLIGEEEILTLYFNDTTRKYPPLTIEEEILVAKRIEAGKNSSDESVIADSEQAQEFLCLSNTRLVVSIAKQYIGRGLSFLDLIQEGNIGVIKASKKFDYTKEARFATYATWWVRQSITNAITQGGRTIRLPRWFEDLVNEMGKTTLKLQQELGRNPNMAEIANAMQITEEEAENIAKTSQKPTSLEAMSIGSNEELEKQIHDEDESSNPETMTIQNLMCQDVLKALDSTATSTQKNVIIYRFIEELTWQQISDLYGNKTKDAGRQAQRTAIKNIKQLNPELRDYLD